MQESKQEITKVVSLVKKWHEIKSVSSPLKFYLHLSHLMTKATKWHVRLAKTQISLHICPV